MYIVFNGKHIDEYIDPNPAAFKRGVFAYDKHDKKWYRNGRKLWSAAPHGNGWVGKELCQVPKHLQAYVLLLT